MSRKITVFRKALTFFLGTSLLLLLVVVTGCGTSSDSPAGQELVSEQDQKEMEAEYTRMDQEQASQQPDNYGGDPYSQ